MNKKVLSSLIVFVLFLSTVTAITGSMGNSRMVLRLEPGEEVEKYILVRNVNDVPLTIDLIPSGDLADNVKLEEESFVLGPGEDKKAYFTIKAEAGTTETKILVRFTPEDGGGVGLSSTIIVFAGVDESTSNQEESEEENPDVNSSLTGNTLTNFISNQITITSKFSSSQLLIIASAILLVIFIALILYSLNKNKKKVRRRNA